MIRIIDQDHYLEACGHAASLGPEQAEKFHRLVTRHAADGHVLAELYPDRRFSLEHSFGFTWFRRRDQNDEWRQWIVGGIIYDKDLKTWGSHT